jgi:hypothetical protein
LSPVRLFYFSTALFAVANRDNKTAIELFVAGVMGWESGLQRRLDNAKPEAT